MTEPPALSWDAQTYPGACTGDGWSAGVVYMPPPDHDPVENPDDPGTCYCGHWVRAHDPADAQSSVWRIVAVSVLNMTNQQQRVNLGDYRTSNADAWQSPWIAVGDDRDYQTPAYDPREGPVGGLVCYMHPDGHPYRVRCS